MVAIYLMLTAIFFVLLCMVKEISDIAKVVEKYNGNGERD